MSNYNDILNKFENRYINKINKLLKKEIDKSSSVSLLDNSMAYSLTAGGKRLRPLLTLAVIASYNHKIDDDILKTSSAVELLHTYSLIHDDLPAMDNSDYRRSKLSNHKKFGDDIAILAGDGLLTLAFEWLANANLNSLKKVKLVSMLSKAAGPSGMVAGQVIDVSSDNKNLNLAELANLDRKKTGELFHYCIIAGAIIADVSQSDITNLSKFAWDFGIAFQIYDDILDNPDNGSLADVDKNTYVSLLGLNDAKKELKHVINDGKEALDNLEQCKSNSLLKSFFSYFEI